MTLSIKDFMVLTKFNLSFAVSLSCVFSFILAKEALNMELLLPFLGVLFLALGVSTLNQYQEYLEDAKMERTKKRPIASNKISPNSGLAISFILILISYFLIYFSLQYTGILIFSLVIVLYNLIYTKIKKTTVYAAVYGAVLGIIPPLVGWLAAGGDLYDIRFLTIALFYFVWQIPHFWLLILKYHNQYNNAGFTTVADRFGVQRLERITFIWLLLTLICGLFTISLFPPKSITIAILLLLLIAYTFYSFFSLIQKHSYLKTFVSTNIFITFVMLLLSINVLI